MKIDCRFSSGFSIKIRRLLLPLIYVSLGLSCGIVLGQDSLDRDYGDQLQRIAPREPEAALQTFEINEGLRAELIACGPMVMDPVAITFDEWGRAFVVEMRGYSEREDQLLGQVKLLEDSDGDGQFDKSTLFADKFRWPTGVVCVNGGILVADAPDLVFLKDADGDGRAEFRQVVFTGFGTSNVQQLPNSLQWGIDNQIYGASGGNGGQLKRVEALDPHYFKHVEHNASDPIDLNGRDFKIDPTSWSHSSISGGTQFGMTFDRWGTRFVCSNSDHCQQIVLEEKYSARNRQQRIERARISIAADGPAAEVFRTSQVEPWRKVRTRLRVQGLVRGPIEGGGRASGYFTSATGITCYDGDLLPPSYLGDLFIGDVGSNLVHRKKLVGDGIQKQAVRVEKNSEFMRSVDNWFRPVQMANAPDGSLVVLDMYRETIEHPASLPPIIKKHLDLNSGNQRGRIYRIVPERGVGSKRPVPGDASLEQLVAMLDHPNGWHRRTSARLLFEKMQFPEDSESICELLRENAMGSTNPETRIRAMYLLSEIDQIRAQELKAMLGDDHPQVRVHALLLCESNFSAEFEAKIVAMISDEDPRVRFQVALTLGELDLAIGDAIVELTATDGQDPWMQRALSSSAYRHRAVVHAGLAKRIHFDPGSQENCRVLFLDLTGQLAREASDQELKQIVEVLGNWPRENELLLGELIAELMSMPPARRQRLDALLNEAEVPLDSLASRVTARARLDAYNESLAENARIVAIEMLRLEQADSSKDHIARLTRMDQAPSVRRAAIALASKFSSPEVGEAILLNFQTFSPGLRSAALQVLLSRENWTLQLLNRIETGKINPVLVDAAFRQRLLQSSTPTIQATAKLLFAGNLNPDKMAVTERYLAQIQRLAGNRDRGRKLFRKSCASCHRLERQGNEIGPNLAAFANRGTAALVTNILDPNREVDPRYLSYLVGLEDGRTLLGVISHETATTIGLQNSEGQTVTILRSEIEEMQSTTLSLMPENFALDIGPQEMADLIDYLLSQGS